MGAGAGAAGEKMAAMVQDRGGVLVTGASRRIGIGSEVVRRLSADGWRVFTTWYTPYDAERPWGSNDDEIVQLLTETGAQGPKPPRLR